MDYRNKLLEFYKDTDYQSLRQSVPRPREWHLPMLIHDNFNDEIDYFISHKQGSKIHISLDYNDMEDLRPTLLHESIFSFYKAFYNYLAAKNLYGSGAVHWINVTAYYAKLFLARAINTLCGKRSYVVNSENYFFVKNIYNVLNPNKDVSEKSSYSLTLDFDIKSDKGSLVFHKERVNSHKEIWVNYTSLNHEELELTKMTDEKFYDNNPMHLSKERNDENYTFEGFSQVDFNLDIGNFEQYFERDIVKNEEELVYDDKLGIVFGVITELYHLYKDLSINRLPIEIKKLEYMISYMIKNDPLKNKLLDLCEEDLPSNNKYITEMNWFYSN
ncbi:hypothetical protein SAMN05421676_10224 [Salinibacillus kushneri]|uniref:Uncharacterized protein n=1 Tax=Salinibacillus kushneri TaxID=237682 RepID=A0A1I0A3K7_9BACI|nr:hypothetical protein [Salinibacillus kushneri]SES88735.1 hypothetical protein SAMN05421676_10224 [Salinibacillus kushneri]